MLVIEYDVLDSGLIELVALVNATDHDESDEDGRVWKAWRDGHPDGGFGYVAVPADILAEMEATEDPEKLRGLVEELIIRDHTAKVERS